MTERTIINVTATLEDLLAEIVGRQPDLVKIADWPGLARQLQRRLEESGLRLVLAGTTAERRLAPVGPLRRDDTAVALVIDGRTAIVKSNGVSLRSVPRGLARQMAADLATQAFDDMVPR